MNVIHHLSEYPPRSTTCGLYYPKKLFTPGFGTYLDEGITCKRCLATLTKIRKELNDNDRT